jgi:hypothetical protein
LRKVGVVVAIAAAVVALSGTAASASVAHVSYGGDACATGITSEYCGAQVNAWDAAITVGYGYGYGYGHGQPLFARQYVDGNPSQQFFWLQYQGGSDDVAVYAPGGVVSNEIMAQVGNRIELVNAPTTVTDNDLWSFNDGDWDNVASGDAIGVWHGLLVPVTGPTSNNWTFFTP